MLSMMVWKEGHRFEESRKFQNNSFKFLAPCWCMFNSFHVASIPLHFPLVYLATLGSQIPLPALRCHEEALV